MVGTAQNILTIDHLIVVEEDNMTPELDAALCKKYPKIFVNRDKSMMESCMYWGLDVGDGWYNIIDAMCLTIQSHINWSVKQHEMTIKYNDMVTLARNGDFTLFNKTYAKLDEPWKQQYLERILQISEKDGQDDYSTGLRRVDPVIPQLVADQVKEKFGSLRMYSHGGDDFCDGVIQMAEAMSVRTCEDCGAPGKLGGRGWIRTLCPAHIKPGEEPFYGEQVIELALDEDEE